MPEDRLFFIVSRRFMAAEHSAMQALRQGGCRPESERVEAWKELRPHLLRRRAAGSLPLRSDRRSRRPARKTCVCDPVYEGKRGCRPGFLEKLEPEIKLFSFDKFAKPFSELTEQEKDEELIHFRTGYSFAKKVVSTGECDVLILDEVLDCSTLALSNRRI
jgi:hypothetical protein